MNVVLEARHINKYFKKPVLFHVLKDINFQIKKGDFASIMGKSGCRKSTFYQPWIPIMRENFFFVKL